MPRGLEHLAHRALLDDLTGVHDRNPVARLGDHREVMGDQEQGQPQVAPQLLEELQDLPLRHHVERRGRLVADHQLGATGERERDHHALAHAAGELVRVLLPAGARDADALEQLADTCTRIDVGLVQADRLADLAIDAHDRVERVHGALEDDRDGTPAEVAPAGRATPVQQHDAALGTQRHLARGASEPARQEAEKRKRRGRLAAPRLAGEPERLAATQREADTVDDRNDRAGILVRDLETADVEQRLVGHDRSRRLLGLTISSRAFPVRLNAMARSVTQIPGGRKYAHLPSVIAPEL